VKVTYAAQSKEKRAATRWRHASPLILFALALALSACGGGSAALGVAGAQPSPTATTLSKGSNTKVPSNTGASRSTTTTSAPTTNTSPAANVTSEALKFAECLRSHGVSNYPDPPANGIHPPAATRGGMTYLGDSFNPNTPILQAAEAACEKYAVGLATRITPAGAAKVEAEQLEYAQCIRSHGVPDFRDPSVDGGFTIPNSVDQNSSFFQAAERACKNFLPGFSGPPGS
jgi:hypothetical protein